MRNAWICTNPELMVCDTKKDWSHNIEIYARAESMDQDNPGIARIEICTYISNG